MDDNIQFIVEEMQKSAIKYNQELIVGGWLSIKETTKYFHEIKNVRYRFLTSGLFSDSQLIPYENKENSKSENTIDTRELLNYLGVSTNVFNPNYVYQSVFGSNTVSGDGLKDVDITRKIMMSMMSSVMTNVANSFFTAKRKTEGTTTQDLFDGFDTIAEQEIALNNLSEEKQNLYNVDKEITSDNAVDVIKDIYRSAENTIIGNTLYMYVPNNIYNMYCDCCVNTYSNTIYYNKFEQTTVIGSNNRCVIVPFSSKKDSKIIQLTTKENMLFGTCNLDRETKIDVIRVKHDDISLQVKMFLGTQYASLDKTRLLIAKIKA